jgi:hypothetical protein
MNEQDLNNLKAVFSIARERVASDRPQLIEILKLEEKVLETLNDDEGSSKKED